MTPDRDTFAPASPTTATASSPFLLLRADATPEMGVGHAMRLLALGQEALKQGSGVVIAGEISIPWVAAAYEASGIEILERPTSPAALAALAASIHASVVLLDGYELSAQNGELLREQGFRVAAMVDGDFGAHQVADIYIDQNPGALPRHVAAHQVAVAGADYTLFRDDVLEARNNRELNARPRVDPTLRVLAVFGGTDPFGAASVVAPLLLRASRESGVPLNLSVVSRNTELAIELESELTPGSTCEVLPAVSDLAHRAAEADVVVTASGSTVWELLCIGVPTAIVCVVDNQTPGYDIATQGGYATGLGHLTQLREEEQARHVAVQHFAQFLGDEAERHRAAQAGQTLLDGHGRERVARLLLSAH